MFCPECGYENNDENKFCMRCGTLLEQGKPEVSYATAVSTTAVTVVNDNTSSPLETEQCGKQLNEDTQTPQANSYSQISGYVSPETIPDVNVRQKKEEFNYALFSSDYKPNYKYKMLNISLGASIIGALIVIIACLMPFVNVDVSLIALFADIPQDSYNVKLVDIESYGMLVMLFMVFLIILSVFKRQKASIAPLASSVALFCYPLIDIYSSFNGDDPNNEFDKYTKKIAENMFEFGAGFYIMIIGFIIISIGIFLAYRDNWDKTTRTMQYIVDGIMTIIVVAAIWLGSGTSDSVSAENSVDYLNNYCCEVSVNYDMNKIL